MEFSFRRSIGCGICEGEVSGGRREALPAKRNL
jgi:hypothetical protein